MAGTTSSINKELIITRGIGTVEISEERKTTNPNGSITWEADIKVTNNSGEEEFNPISNILNQISTISKDTLDTQSQSSYSKSYDGSTASEQSATFKACLGTQWKTNLKRRPKITTPDSDIDTIVDAIISVVN